VPKIKCNDTLGPFSPLATPWLPATSFKGQGSFFGTFKKCNSHLAHACWCMWANIPSRLVKTSPQLCGHLNECFTFLCFRSPLRSLNSLTHEATGHTYNLFELSDACRLVFLAALGFTLVGDTSVLSRFIVYGSLHSFSSSNSAQSVLEGCFTNAGGFVTVEESFLMLPAGVSGAEICSSRCRLRLFALGCSENRTWQSVWSDIPGQQAAQWLSSHTTSRCGCFAIVRAIARRSGGGVSSCALEYEPDGARRVPKLRTFPKFTSDPPCVYYPLLSTPQWIPIWAPRAFASAAGKQGGGTEEQLSWEMVFGKPLQ
jgi:hypothetical protein